MFRWGVVPALLLAAIFVLPVSFATGGPGRDGLELTAQVEGQQLGVVAFSPFCIVLEVGDSDFGVTTSYLVRRVQLGGSSRFDSTPSSSLVLNPRGREDVRVPMSFGSAPLRARWVPLVFGGIEAAPLDSSNETG